MLRDIEAFALERYFAQWEFSVAHQLSASDVEPLTLPELLALADDDARTRWETLSLGYTESAGLPGLRREIATLYDTIAPEQLIVTAGAEESIFLLVNALVSPGDHVVVVTPAYQSLISVASAAGARVTPVALRRERAWRLDLDELSSAVTPGTRALIVNFPHNPTGAQLSPDEQRTVIDLAGAAGAVLISDEVYRGLPGDGVDLPAAADRAPTAVSIGVMSKSFALAGLRIGWIATRNATVLRDVARLKDYTTICNSAPAEVLSLVALRARHHLLTRSRDIVAGNVAHAERFMHEHRTLLDWHRPSAGSTAFPWLHGGDADDLATRLRERASVLLLPGRVFGAAPGHFRLGLGRRDLPLALEQLGHCLPG